GLIGSDGTELPLQSDREIQFYGAGALVELKDQRESWTFRTVSSRPVPSLLRNFSAPVTLEFEYSDSDLTFLLAHDSDPFSRYEAGQRLGMRCLHGLFHSTK